jgi:hypothetical protein
MLLTFYPFEYDSTGRIVETPFPRKSYPMAIGVEQVRLTFDQSQVEWIPDVPGMVKLLLKANYTIRGLAEMADFEDNRYLTPLPVIEIDQVSTESSPTEHHHRGLRWPMNTIGQSGKAGNQPRSR